MKNLKIGDKCTVTDNSCIIKLSNNEWANLYRKTVEVVTTPFKQMAMLGCHVTEYEFVLVKYHDELYRVLSQSLNEIPIEVPISIGCFCYVQDNSYAVKLSNGERAYFFACNCPFPRKVKLLSLPFDRSFYCEDLERTLTKEFVLVELDDVLFMVLNKLGK